MTAYDTPTAEILDGQGVDFILVGDSVGMVVLGYPSTVMVTMDEMIHHAKAVRRGVRASRIIGDLPLKGVEKGPSQALVSARRFMDEAGCDAVKIEWGKHCLKTVDLLVKNKIPVLGHIGLTPQSATRGFKVQGQTVKGALELLKSAVELEKRGVFGVLLECVPWPVAKQITETLKVPTIGIGAGSYCDGQVLVFPDVVGLFKKFSPRFVKRYADVDSVMRKAVSRYVADVKKGRFPKKKQSFGMKPEELFNFRQAMLKRRGR